MMTRTKAPVTLIETEGTFGLKQRQATPGELAQRERITAEMTVWNRRRQAAQTAYAAAAAELAAAENSFAPCDDAALIGHHISLCGRLQATAAYAASYYRKIDAQAEAHIAKLRVDLAGLPRIRQAD